MKLGIYTNFMNRNFWIHLVWSCSTITSKYLYRTARSVKTFDIPTLYTNFYYWMLFMIVSDLLLQKCLQIVKPFPLWLIPIEQKPSIRMDQIMLDKETIQLTSCLKPLKYSYSIPISSLMGVLSNKYLEYQWVVVHPLLLTIYTYHGANIAIRLK